MTLVKRPGCAAAARSLPISAWAALLLACSATATPSPPDFEVTAPPPALGIPSFYAKFVSVDGYPVVGSPRVSDFAMKEAAYIVRNLLAHRPEVGRAMAASGSRLCVMASGEFTTDLPEFANLGSPRGFASLPAKDYWDARARGTGGSEEDPYCSCGEENLLGYPGDPYAEESILIHEFAHNMHLRGMVRVDPTFDARVKAAYEDALSRGLWKGKYASVNHHEYFAEGVQSWCDTNRENDHDHNHVDTREELEAYDPPLAALCREVLGDDCFRYTRPETRLEGHLAGYDPRSAPAFVWPERLKEAKALIRKRAEARSRKGKASGRSPR